MASVKTKVVNTETTNPAEFLAGGPVASTPAPVAPPPDAEAPASEPPGSSVPVSTIAQSAPVDPAAPVRPGLEAQPATTLPPQPPDPFVLIAAFESGNTQRGFTYRNLAALSVPGGVIVRLASVRGSNFSDSICFVPGVKIENGNLVADSENVVEAILKPKA